METHTTSLAERMREVCRHIESHSDEPLPLAELAAIVQMSRFHFARSFKSVVGVSPKQYAAEFRLRRLKRGLRSGDGVDAAVYDAGYGSSSRVYENAATRLGMTPAQYRRAGAGVTISYATLQTPAGLMLIGATDRGICFVGFGDSADELLAQLRAEYRHADVEAMRDPEHPQFRAWIDAIARHLSGESQNVELPLDVAATAFQMRVWQYLQSIPYGELRSYGEVAAAIGQPTASRAVAQACASNPVAFMIPCHRVIRGNGDLGGYRWGLSRKRALIDRERANV
ncbi:MAG TPA: methylated-DNA--[protein]-cysteine S-methyltransferase [Candidatus Baltobacteraceae bacterium]|nr:methylated-DNA--[protein]-cysteine S-methyltransferase [Candidatus Baltobacteraceae bacterium]